MRCFALILLVLAGLPGVAHTQTPPTGGATSIQWEVRNRFRLLRSEQDFKRLAAASARVSTTGGGVLAVERILARESDGRGWARSVVDRLCVDAVGKLIETCDRDGEKEAYLKPQDFPVRATVVNAPAGATCAWSFDTGEERPQQITLDCTEEVTLRVAAARGTMTSLDVIPQDGPVQKLTADMTVRDLLIAGLGDSIAAGEGNPDRAVALADEGFCFRRFLGTAASEYFRPSRAGFRGSRACEVAAQSTGAATSSADWLRQGARWMNAACHRSLYGYQMRAALALAIDNPHAAVTFLPLACSGATIEAGLFKPQRARECGQRATCDKTSPAQIEQLQAMLRRAGRPLDLLFLTIGANDIQFSGLVGDVIIQDTTERALSRQGGMVVSVSEAQTILDTELPASFVRLRAALKPLVGGDLRRVLYTSYGHPALTPSGAACESGRDGFDVHPALNADAARMRPVSEFVTARFLPAIKALATCSGGTLCKDPATERMSFADGHQQAFAAHGFCARSDEDPVFDRVCFSSKGDSFESDPITAAEGPLACELRASDYRPYASRARWVRTANDSYFTAMTYPEGLPAVLQPRDIHDAMWGIVSALYGGAIHPTAEGHAAMADAALPVARALLDLQAAPEITAQPLPPPAQ